MLGSLGGENYKIKAPIHVESAFKGIFNSGSFFYRLKRPWETFQTASGGIYHSQISATVPLGQDT